MVYKRRFAFTIIELLVVIVVIGIIAGIIIISFSGTSQRATASSLQSDLSNAKKQILNFQVENSIFPTRNICPTALATDICIKTSSTNTLLSYAVNNSSRPSFSLIATNSGLSYIITDTTTPTLIPSYITNGLILNLDAANSASYPGSGTIWYDISGNNNNASLTSTTYDSANSGSIVFDGSNSSGAISANTLFNLTQISIGVWFKTPSNFGTQFRALLSKQSGADRDYNLYASNLLSGSEVNRLHYSSARLGAASSINLNYSQATNTWHYITLTVDVNGLTVYYLDGVALASFSGTSGNANSSYPIWIGKADNIWLGNISVVQLYNRPLSALEVAQNFNAMRGRYGL